VKWQLTLLQPNMRTVKQDSECPCDLLQLHATHHLIVGLTPETSSNHTMICSDKNKNRRCHNSEQNVGFTKK
jgi:hypothetical protein